MGSRNPLEENVEKRLKKRITDSMNEPPPEKAVRGNKDSEPAFYGDDYFIITEGTFRGRRGKYRSNPDGTRAQ